MKLSLEHLSSLPPELRLVRYHELCEETLERAVHAATAAERAELIAMANSWRSLAVETEELVKALWSREIF
ncbi:MAG TPA: hypothetical protein VN685_00420 [Rhizomicrobium sp.]|nr:hypothetical protein [Rhizomicrobium sp.]